MLGTLACVLSSLAAPVCAQTTSGAAPSTPNADGLSFEQIYELAARDNLQVNAVRQRRAVAEAGIQIARQRPNPELITGYTRSEPRLNYSVSQPLELGGKRARRIEVARNELRLTELDVDAALRTLRRDVRAAYFNLALARNIRDTGQQAIEQAQALADLARTRFAAGDIAQFEVLQANLAVDRAANDLARLASGELVARASLNQLLNRPPDAPLDLRDSLFGATTAAVATDELIGRALAQNVELRTAEQQIATEESRLRLARAERVPDLLLEPGIESIDPALPNSYGFKLQVTVPLPLFNRGRGEVARSRALVAQLRAEQTAVRQRIAAEIGQAALRLAAARAQVTFYETKLLPDAERVRQLANESYGAGQTSLLSVIDAARNAREVRQGYLQALFDYQSALADLEQAAGVNL